MNNETEELIGSEGMDTSETPVSNDETRSDEEMQVAQAPEKTEEPVETEESGEPEDAAETEESVEGEEAAESEESGETEEPEKTEEPENDQQDIGGETETTPLNDRILAIKSAINAEEKQSQIENKIRMFKSSMENAEQTDPIAAEPEQDVQEISSAQAPDKQKTKKKKKKKKQKFSLFPRRGDKPTEVIRKCIFLTSSAIFVVCLALIVEYFWNNHYNSTLNEGLDKIYQETLPAEPDETTAPTMETFEYYGYLPNVEDLLKINPDVAGWISIPGTSISYPVLQRRGNDDGNEYYLKRNIYHEDAHAGSIFMDYRNDFDYVIDGKKQLANSANLIIYGHNMHDYSMFGSLKHYINDANYYSEHPIVELNSNYRKYKYKIFAMIIVDIDDETETRFDYWNKLEFADEKDFYDYVNEIKRRTIRLNEVDVKYGDELLTLSTCNSTFSDGRLVVFARKLRDDEDLYSGTETSTANPNIKWPNSYYRWNRKTYDPDAEFVPYG